MADQLRLQTLTLFAEFLEANSPTFPETRDERLDKLHTAWTALQDTARKLISARIAVSTRRGHMERADQSNEYRRNAHDYRGLQSERLRRIQQYAAQWAAAIAEYNAFCRALETAIMFYQEHAQMQNLITGFASSSPSSTIDQQLYWWGLRCLQRLIEFCSDEIGVSTITYLNSVPNHGAALTLSPMRGGLSLFTWEDVRALPR